MPLATDSGGVREGGEREDLSFGSQRLFLLQIWEPKMVVQSESPRALLTERAPLSDEGRDLAQESECRVVCALCLWEQLLAALNSIY